MILDLNEKAGATILVVTYGLHATFHITTRIALLSRGRIVESGPPAVIKASHNAIITEFLAAAPEDPRSADGSRRVAPLPQPYARAFLIVSSFCPGGTELRLLGPTLDSKLGRCRVDHRPTNQRSSFDKTGGEGAEEFAQVPAMKQQFPRLAPFPIPQENGQIYFAIIVGGATILLMILAAMKFFGT